MAGENGCDVGHFNLAMKRVAATDSASGLCYYVDPTPFLGRPEAVPRWTEECRDFSFKHIGQLVHFSSSTRGWVAKVLMLVRFAVNVGKKIVVSQVERMPDSGYMGILKDISREVVQNIDLDPANLQNLFSNDKRFVSCTGGFFLLFFFFFFFF